MCIVKHSHSPKACTIKNKQPPSSPYNESIGPEGTTLPLSSVWGSFIPKLRVAAEAAQVVCGVHEEAISICPSLLGLRPHVPS